MRWDDYDYVLSGQAATITNMHLVQLGHARHVLWLPHSAYVRHSGLGHCMRWPTRSVQTIDHVCDRFEIGFGAILQFSLLPQLAKDQALDPPNPKRGDAEEASLLVLPKTSGQAA